MSLLLLNIMVILIMAAYKFKLNDEEYAELRKASMTGKFMHDFEKIGGTVKVKTHRPHLLAEELENVIPSGETSWREILGIE